MGICEMLSTEMVPVCPVLFLPLSLVMDGLFVITALNVSGK
jgi:hypothetical protein